MSTMPSVSIGLGTLSYSGSDALPGRGTLAYRRDPTVPGHVGTYDLTNNLIGAIRPRADRPGLYPGLAHQLYGWRIDINGVTIPPHWLIGPVSVQLSTTGTTWSFALPVHREGPDHVGELTLAPVAGSPFAYAGAAPGLESVDIWGLYLTAAGVLQIKLVTNGMVTDQTRSGGPPDLDAFAGGGAELRYDRQLVTVYLPQGHGLTGGALVRRILTAGDDPVPASTLALDAGNRRYKRVEIVNGERVSEARAVLEPENRLLYVDTDGNWVNPVRVSMQSGARTEAAINESEIAAGNGVTINGVADVVTEICLTGTEQVTREVGACELRTVTTTHETFRDYAPRVATQRQLAVDGSLVSAAAGSPVSLWRLVRRVTVRQVFECDTLMSETTMIEEWYWPRAARYYLAADPDGAIDGYYAVWLEDAGAVQDDTAEAFATEREAFMPVSLVHREMFYELDEESGLTTLRREREREARWFARAGSVKVRTLASDPWESENYAGEGGPSENRAQVYGGGDGVRDRREYWFDGINMPSTGYGLTNAATFAGVTQPYRETEVEHSVDGRYVTGRSTTTTSWAHRDGYSALYSDGSTSRDAEDTWLPIEEVVESYTAADNEAGHTATITRFALGSRDQLDTEERSGYLPAATVKEDLEPPDGVYVDGDDAAPKAASWYEKRPLEVEIEAAGLLAYHRPRKEVLESPWAENTLELQSQALRILREGSAIGVQITMAGIDFSIRQNTIVPVTARNLELAHNVEVESVGFSDPVQPGAAAQTTFVGRISVI